MLYVKHTTSIELLMASNANCFTDKISKLRISLTSNTSTVLYPTLTLPSNWTFQFLADRTNGRAIATLLRLSSVCRL